VSDRLEGSDPGPARARGPGSADVASFWARNTPHEDALDPFYEKFVDFAIAPSARARPLRILELGCGLGLLSSYLRERLAAEVVGMDVAPALLELARRRAGALGTGLAFVAGDVTRPPFAPGQRFDVVTGISILHEVPADAFPAMIAAIGGLLAPGGFGVFLENSAFNPLIVGARALTPRRLRLSHPGERPFDPVRFAMIERAFPVARRDCVGVVLFRRLYTQFLARRLRGPGLSSLCSWLDLMATRWLPPGLGLWLSYQQVVSFSRSGSLHRALDFDVVPRPWRPAYLSKGGAGPPPPALGRP
jgi:SAM-dependent methyltransferase